ncbi:MAG TPA: DUF4142 domain-containing protein [Asticcacaulis sp.]|nr:DUF4142 domain-containing protein [Asticcacaulis sp.]
MFKLTRSRLMTTSVCAALAVGAFSLSACNKSQQTQTSDTASSAMSDAGAMMSDTGSMIADAVTPDTPQDFVNKAAVANQFEIDESQLALKTSKNADVLAFARRMVKDHTKAGKDMAAAVAKSGAVTAPSTALDDAHQSKLDDLKTKTGKDFDDDYISDQKDAHSEAVSLFDNYAKNGDDPALKDFAASTLPTLQAHKDAIDKM